MVIEKTQERIENCLNEGEGLRLNEKSFTWKGKLGAKRILHLILQRIYLVLQLHLDNYYDEIGECPVSRDTVYFVASEATAHTKSRSLVL